MIDQLRDLSSTCLSVVLFYSSADIAGKRWPDTLQGLEKGVTGTLNKLGALKCHDCLMFVSDAKRAGCYVSRYILRYTSFSHDWTNVDLSLLRINTWPHDSRCFYLYFLFLYHSYILHRWENRMRPISTPHDGRCLQDSNLCISAYVTSTATVPWFKMWGHTCCLCTIVHGMFHKILVWFFSTTMKDW